MNHDRIDVNIPFIAYESGMDRQERANKRLWMMCVFLALALLATNLCWVFRERQFTDETTTITQEVESDGDGSAIINDGVHINDTGKTDSND